MSIQDQPPPVARDAPGIWAMVVQDMHDRDKLGRARYGTALQAFNGRDALVDLYQELLDAVVYVRQELEERIKYRELLLRCEAALKTIAAPGSTQLLRDLDTVLSCIRA